jgi:hypothetical protein
MQTLRAANLERAREFSTIKRQQLGRYAMNLERVLEEIPRALQRCNHSLVQSRPVSTQLTVGFGLQRRKIMGHWYLGGPEFFLEKFRLRGIEEALPMHFWLREDGEIVVSLFGREIEHQPAKGSTAEYCLDEFKAFTLATLYTALRLLNIS